MTTIILIPVTERGSKCTPRFRIATLSSLTEMRPSHSTMNEIERKLEQARKLMLLWQESEWRLNFLRSINATPLTDPTPEQLVLWKKHIQEQPSIYQPPPPTVWN